MIRRAIVVLAVLAASGGMVGCSSGSGPGAGSPRRSVSVLYAGSLVELMERRIGPAFERATGDAYTGYGAGSSEVASDITSRAKTGDVFISASPTVDAALRGSGHGDWVRWWSTFATAPLVVAYSPESRFAADFRTKPWYDVVTEPGIRLGRTDPTLDPKGALTVHALRQAQRAYRLPGFAPRVESAAQVFPEEQLIGRLSAGQLDAGFFYSNEAAAAHLPTVGLGKVTAAATFTVTVLNRAPDPQAANGFVRFLLTDARPILRRGGLRLPPPRLAGDPAAVPPPLRAVTGG